MPEDLEVEASRGNGLRWLVYALTVLALILCVIVYILWHRTWDLGNQSGNGTNQTQPRLGEKEVKTFNIADNAVGFDQLSTSLQATLTGYDQQISVLQATTNSTTIQNGSTTIQGVSTNTANTWTALQTFNNGVDINSTLNANAVSNFNGPVVVSTASCASPFTTVYCLNGNSFGTTAELGTNDAQSLNFETAGVTHMTINATGEIGIAGAAVAGKALTVNGDLRVTGVIDPIELQFSGTPLNGAGYRITTLANNPLYLNTVTNRTDAVQIRQADNVTAVVDVDTLNKRLGVNTSAPTTDFHVVGSQIITGHSAIGPSATLGDGLLVTPLPPPNAALQIRRTQYVAETITDLSTAPALPAGYVATGNELLLNPTTDPSSYFFGGAYSVVTVAPGNAQNFGTVLGQLDGVTHKGTGIISNAYGTVTGVMNLDGGIITGAIGHVIGSTNADPAGVIANNVGMAVFPVNNDGTVLNSTGVIVFDQAFAFGVGTNPVAAANIVTTGAAVNQFGGTTQLNNENSPNLTANIDSPYDVATKWTNSAGNNLPTAMKDMGYAYANGYVYLTGGRDGGGILSTVYYSKINADGSFSWTATTALPAPRTNHRTYIQNGYIYVVGGVSAVFPIATVSYARLNADGTVGTWRTTTSLPAARSFFGGTQYNGTLYAIAGVSAAFASTSTVYYAVPNSDGSISAWTTSATPIPAAWNSADAVVANGYIYYLAGGGATIYYAKLNPDGSNGAWSTNATAPTFTTLNHMAFINSGTLYMVGGRLCAFLVCNAQPTIFTAPINTDGSLGTFTANVSNMPVARASQAGFNINGNIYQIGGEDVVANVSTLEAGVYGTMTRKVQMAGAVDLVSLVGGSQSDYGLSTSLKAGNTEIAGAFSVFGDGLFRNNLSALGNVNFASGATVGGNVTFDQEVAHSIKLNNSTTAATAGAALSVLGANGTGAAGGDLILQAGTGTTNGNIQLNSTTGNVGIHNAAPGFNLHVGDAGIASGTTVARFQNAGGTCDVTPNVVGAVTCTSDIRVKKNITEITDTLAKIGAIKVYSYNLKAEEDTDPVHVGFLAQELEQIMPDLVLTDKDGMKSVSYAGLTPYLVQALKQQQAQINDLTAKVNAPQPTAVTVDVLAELAKAKVIAINGNLIVNGRVEFSSENKGTAKVPVGIVKQHVDFVRAFAQLPNVVISPNDFVDGSYRTSSVTATGFDLELQTPQAAEVNFSWQAF